MNRKPRTQPRPRILREFLAWLRQSAPRLAVPVAVDHRTDRWVRLRFIGASACLSITLTRQEINVSADWQGDCWDLLFCEEVSVACDGRGHYCRLCLPEFRVSFPSRAALWHAHLFEPFLAWVNQHLATASWIALNRRGGCTWAELSKEPPSISDNPDVTTQLVPLWAVPYQPPP